MRGTFRWKRARKTHCKRGHPLSGDNLMVRQRPTYTEHRCRACNALACRLRRDRKKRA